MDAVVSLPKLHVAVLRSMTMPDSEPPEILDSAGAAIHRRLPVVAPGQAAQILHDLNALGLTNVPYIEGMVSSASTACLWKYITDEGWRVLGLGQPCVAGQEN